MAAIYNPCSSSTRERILAANFGEESKADTYTYQNLLNMLGAIYSSVEHAVVAQRQIAQGLKQTQLGLIVYCTWTEWM